MAATLSAETRHQSITDLQKSKARAVKFCPLLDKYTSEQMELRGVQGFGFKSRGFWAFQGISINIILRVTSYSDEISSPDC